MLLRVGHQCWGQSLRRSWLADNGADPPLRDLEQVGQVIDCGPAASRGQESPRFNSLSMSISNG